MRSRHRLFKGVQGRPREVQGWGKETSIGKREGGSHSPCCWSLRWGSGGLAGVGGDLGTQPWPACSALPSRGQVKIPKASALSAPLPTAFLIVLLCEGGEVRRRKGERLYLPGCGTWCLCPCWRGGRKGTLESGNPTVKLCKGVLWNHPTWCFVVHSLYSGWRMAGGHAVLWSSLTYMLSEESLWWKRLLFIQGGSWRV